MDRLRELGQLLTPDEVAEKLHLFCDIASGWWEKERVLGREKERCFNGIILVRERTPFKWKELHPDNDTPFINFHLVRYLRKRRNSPFQIKALQKEQKLLRGTEELNSHKECLRTPQVRYRKGD
ncbi:hypothetical protein H5U35_04695 [Candidatus Aerophobetes bacterium]|nr:hypothetical protein [Candidatus Aerophobetes bacterium]